MDTKEPAVNTTPVNTKPVVKTNQIELAIVELADPKTGKLVNPAKVIAQHLNVPEADVNEKIRQLKRLKLLTATRSNNNPRGFGYLKLNESLISRLGKNAKPSNGEVAESNGLEIKSSGNGHHPSINKPILVVMDYENIYHTERHSGQRISLPKLKQYIRNFGSPIYAVEVFVPHHFFKEQNQRQIDYIWKSGCMALHCPNWIKDKDQVDNLMMDRIRQATYLYPHTEVWIVSRDSDFMRLIEINKDRGLHTIKMVNPFDIPEVLGYEDHELATLLSRPVLNLKRSAEMLAEKKVQNQTDEHALIRQTMAWLKKSDEILIYNNHVHFVDSLKKHLNKVERSSLSNHPGFPVNIVPALKEMGVLRQIDHRTSYRIQVDRNHNLFSILDQNAPLQNHARA